MKLLSFDEAVTSLWRGDVVAVPTDTVYGVAARLFDPSAVTRLFEVKSRPRNVALPVLLASAIDVQSLEVEWSTKAQALADNFWPGALTIVVKAPASSAALVGASATLGLRVPRHEALANVIVACGPLAVTSANEHGGVPSTSAEDVRAVEWGAPVGGVMDGGVCNGAVSSVVELTSRGWRLVRSGALSARDIAKVIGPESSVDDQ